MNEKLVGYISNSVTFRLLIEIQEQGQSTAKKLAETYPDIPQATLYRYLNRMLKDDVLKIVEENKIRGTVEKVYALNLSLTLDRDKFEKEHLCKEYLRLFTQFSMDLLRNFQEYTNREDADISADGLAFWSMPLYLTQQELEEMRNEIQGILDSRFANMPTDKRKLRNISVVFGPPKSYQNKNKMRC